MSNRYAPLPNPRSDRDAQHEMEAAFDDSDDEDATESQPLNVTYRSAVTAPQPATASPIPGSYDFENVDYDYPPPGSPPPLSSTALPNNFGNSNGLIPSFNIGSLREPLSRQGWFKRTVGAILPSHYVNRSPQHPEGVFGGGTSNDGVFANVTAKPSRAMRVQQGDEILIVSEDARPEAPPSYASAQADAVPPYWETTVHAPLSSDSLGEMIIDALPTGSLFSFLWNMLVSISFQFVGFLLTYLLHTTHAARLGSRAGLGVTLIQYGFALRGRLDSTDGEGGWGQWRADEPAPTMATAAEADAYYSHHDQEQNSTVSGMMNGMEGNPSTLTDEQASMLVADATTEWLSFFLMTVGWFILLTSLLGFWRVKRWERGILATQQHTNTNTNINQDPQQRAMSQFERAFGLHRLTSGGGDILRQGFGFGRSHEEETDSGGQSQAEEGRAEEELAALLDIPADDPNRAQRIREALESERRLQDDLRAAGLL
ncbi:uncharacterized protein BT62DRAFT_887639 [Guyanagaster necrorhizus]|uniref:Metal homeostatis protein bsd2 n=1 Tax=Guyanagaster necrorhizus TaxID=856835 RepID=A0A9P8AVH3_9AGAR|nr:uncharacterized protein BT62DRAFT_887639 [Guyanagaster necrorhizus MCA 3950]KAG7449091.1 hypothetical protein BT62DRAFT_887639 [Guyanagaster necrorhizus MCA 3950]